MKKQILLMMLAAGTMGLASCRTVQDAQHVPPGKLAGEGTLVFVRPDRYSVLGTRSIRDYVEITYERAVRNEAGLLTVEVGFRNRGGQHWYDRRGPNFPISVKTTFYKAPVAKTGPTGAPAYETNWQTVTLVRGDTGHFQATCLVPAAQYYQVTASEHLSGKNQ